MESKSNLKVAILTDEYPSPNGKGLSQTLYNVFELNQKLDVLWITPKIKDQTIVQLTKSLSYTFETFPSFKNRLGFLVNPIINWLNFSLRAYFRNFKTIRSSLKEFNPAIKICCPNGVIGVVMGEKIFKDIKGELICYFMDDWMRHSSQKWLFGNADIAVKNLLMQSKRWLVISEGLQKILEERYNVTAMQSLVIHNPVVLANHVSWGTNKNRENQISIAYAGSLWPMHFDALILIAKAITSINKKHETNIDLIIYTSSHFWEWRKKELNNLEVLYGGNISYDQIHAKLNQSDILLITASFLDEWKTHSIGSLQTKLTDYLNSKRLVLSCGPAYSANNSFIKKYDCGICIETDNIHEIERELEDLINDFSKHTPKVQNGWRILEQEFSSERVSDKLISFLND